MKLLSATKLNNNFNAFSEYLSKSYFNIDLEKNQGGDMDDILDYDEYDDYIEHLAEKEDEYYDEIIFEELSK